MNLEQRLVGVPALHPADPQADMPDFVRVHRVHHGRSLPVAYTAKQLGVVASVVEVGLLEGQAHVADERRRLLEIGHRAPEVATHPHIAHFGAQRPHALEVQAQVTLLVANRRRQSATKRGGRIDVAQQGERHQLEREQLVVGEVVQRLAPRPRLGERVIGGEWRDSVGQPQWLGPPRRGRGANRRPGVTILERVRGHELVRQGFTEQDLLGKRPDAGGHAAR